MGAFSFMYQQSTNHGSRLPGWEDINMLRLAKALDCDVKHLREGLTGRRNVTIEYLRRVARALGTPLPNLLARIEEANRLYVEMEQEREKAREKKRQARQK